MILSKSTIEALNLDLMVDEYARNGRMDEILFIVATNRKARHLHFQIVNQSPEKACAGLHIFTLSSLAQSMLRASGKDFTLIPEDAALILLNRCFESAVQEGYFSKYKDYLPEGIVRITRQLFAQWNRELLSPENIESQIASSASEYEKMKLQAVLLVYRAYLEQLVKFGFAEMGDVYESFTAEPASIAQAFRKKFPTVQKVIVQEYSEFSSTEGNALAVIADAISGGLFIDLDIHAANLALFAQALKTADLLKKAGFKEITDSREELNPFRGTLKQKLFTFSGKQSAGKMELFRIEAPAKEEEVRAIAKLIKQKITEAGVRPGQICVAINLIREYSPLLKSIFSATGIPFTLTDRPVLCAAPVVVAIMNMLDVARSDYYYKAIIRAFSGVFFQPVYCSTNDLLAVAARQRIISGLDKWVAAEESETNFDEERQSLTAAFAAQRCVKEIRRLSDLLKPFETAMTPDQFSHNLNKFIAGMKVHELLISSDIEKGADLTGAINSLRSLVAELCAILKTAFGRDVKFRLSRYLDEISRVASYTRYTVIVPSTDAVLITAPEEIRGLSFEHLFLAGLYDGNFPARYSPDLFSPAALARDERQYIADQQYIFYQALSSARKSLWLSYPNSESGKIVYPSNFLAAFSRLFEMKVIHSAELSGFIADDTEKLMYDGRMGRNAAFNETQTVTDPSIAASIELDRRRFAGAKQENGEGGTIDHTILNSAAKARLEYFKTNQYSVSQLETYAGCPFRYFLARVMKISALEEPEDEETRKEFGSVIHQILFEFYNEMSIDDRTFAGLSGQELSDQKEKLFLIAKKVIEETPEGKKLGKWDKEIILGINGNRDASILSKFIEAEAAGTAGDAFPALLEAGFGTLSRAAAASSGSHSNSGIEIGGITMNGKIDRVEIDRQKKAYHVVDYKSSFKKERFNETLFDEGVSLQIPVYLRAAGELLKQAGLIDDEYDPMLGVIYSLQYKDENFGRKNVIIEKGRRPDGKINPHQILNDEEIKAKTKHFIEQAGGQIAAYVQQIVDGKFSLTTLSGTKRITFACGYCEFGRACRIAERVETESPANDGSDPEQ